MDVEVTNLGRQKKIPVIKTYIPPGFINKKQRKQVLNSARRGSKNALANMREAKQKDKLRKSG